MLRVAPISRTVPLDEDGRPLERTKVEQYEAELRLLAGRGQFNVADEYHVGAVRGYDVVQDMASAMRDLGVPLDTTPGNGRFDLGGEQQDALRDGLEDYFG